MEAQLFRGIVHSVVDNRVKITAHYTERELAEAHAKILQREAGPGFASGNIEIISRLAELSRIEISELESTGSIAFLDDREDIDD